MKKAIKNLKEYGFNSKHRVYIVAEIGINHGGDIKRAKQLIDSAARAGVDAVKFQTYITEKRVSSDSPVFGILKRCELPLKAFKELKEHTAQYNIDFFSTPFDMDSLAYLESINCVLYKVASFDVVNHKFLSQIAATRKPVIMSVGMSSLAEIKDAYRILKSQTSNIAILHCMSAYPTREQDANLAAIYHLKEEFDCVIGQSDHTADIIVPLYAVAAGAQIIEKHYKIDTKIDCADGLVSITEVQMQKLIQEARRLENILGEGEFGVRKAEIGCEIFRRQSN